MAGVQPSKRLDVQTSERPGVQAVEPMTSPVAIPSERPAVGASPIPRGDVVAVQASNHSDAQTPKRLTLKRQDGRELRKMTLYLQPDLARRLAVRSAETGADMSEIVALALDAFFRDAH